MVPYLWAGEIDAKDVLVETSQLRKVFLPIYPNDMNSRNESQADESKQHAKLVKIFKCFNNKLSHFKHFHQVFLLYD